MMHCTILAPLAALAAVAFAAENPFNVPKTFALTAGKPTTLTWNPTTEGTVTLRLRQGASNNLEDGTVIKSGIPNTGSYTYTPPADAVRGSDYSIEISPDGSDDPQDANYTPYFVLESSNTVASQSADTASASETASADESSAAATSMAAMSTMSAAMSSMSAAMTSESAAASSSAAAASTNVSSRLSSVKSSASSSASAASKSASPTVSGPTSSSTGAGSEAGSSAAPSSGAVLGAVGKMNVQAGFLALLLSAVAAW